MQVMILDTLDDIGEYCAALIIRDIDEGRLTVLGVTTGLSPLPVYEALIHLDSSAAAGLTAFALDEYVGVVHEDPQSYHSVIHRDVTVPLGLDSARVHVPDGAALDLSAACVAYEVKIISAGGVDL